MEFRVLGPLEVRRGGRPLPLGGQKQRSLLALLLLHANEVVAQERLIDELWGERPPETALTALQGYVSQLRKLVGKDRIVTRPPGYQLAVEDGELDLTRFQSLVGDAGVQEPERAAETLRDALALWRGPALADLAYETAFQTEIERLEELRLATLEQRIEADLELGRHADLVPELEALVGDHPLRERFRAQLMLALYRSGRQADALDAYQATRRMLVEELGIDPSPALQDLERQILRQDPALRPPRRRASVPARRTAAPFVGRERELALLLDGLEDALGGRGRLFLLAGEPGIGKSRLADEFAGRAVEHGATVVWGRCWEAGGAPAYWPWIQALRAVVSGRSAEEIRREIGDGAPELTQVLPELKRLFPDLPEPPSLDPESARFRLFDAVTRFLTNVARERPLVLILDDLHAADEPSLLLLRFFGRELGSARLLIVSAYRDIDPALAEPLSGTLTDLAREPATRRLHLRGFSETVVGAFIQQTVNIEPSQQLVAAIHDETEGNPLFVGEVVRLLDAEERLAEPEAHLSIDAMLPETVREVIGRRVERLSAPCKRVLTLASVLGRDFDLGVLEVLADAPSDEFSDALDEARAERVALDVPGTSRRLRFSHVLVRDVLYDRLSSARRADLHRRAGETLEHLYATDLNARLPELAHHFFHAARRGEATKAVEYARRAGEQATSVLAFEEAARLYRIGLEALALDRPLDGTARSRLLVALGEAQARAGDMRTARETFLAAAGVASEVGLEEELARAALGHSGRFPYVRARGDAQSIELLERALASLQDEGELRVRVLARLAGLLRDEAEPRRRTALSDEAVAIARRLGDPGALAYALASRFGVIWRPENPDERFEIAAELTEAARAARDGERLVDAHLFRFWASLERRDRPAAYAELDHAVALAQELRQPAQEWIVTLMNTVLALLEGRFEEAEAAIWHARSLERVQMAEPTLFVAVELYTLARDRGGMDELEGAIRPFAESLDLYPHAACMLAAVYAELGRDAEARYMLREIASAGFIGWPMDNEGVFGLTVLGEVVRELDDRSRAERLYELLLPYDGLEIVPGEVSHGTASRCLGILAGVTERWDAAIGHFGSSLATNAAMNARPLVARTQYDYARMLLAPNGPRDPAHARELLTAALDACEELGMPALGGRVARLLRAVPTARLRARSRRTSR